MSTSTEWGVFTDEGLVAGDFYSREEAERWVAENLDADDGATVAELCIEHRDQAHESCESCAAGDEDDDA